MTQIAQEHKIAGVHGPLIDLFEVPEQFVKCVEITAGNSLYNVVVDNDEIATRLIEQLNKNKLGRKTTLLQGPPSFFFLC